jgi:hypothetical protein
VTQALVGPVEETIKNGAAKHAARHEVVNRFSIGLPLGVLAFTLGKLLPWPIPLILLALPFGFLVLHVSVIGPSPSPGSIASWPRCAMRPTPSRRSPIDPRAASS